MRRLLPLYLVVFFGFVAYSIQIPIFTSLMFDPEFGPLVYPNLHVSIKKLVLGVVLSMYPLGQFFGSPILGALSDRLGRKKVLLIALSLTILATFATAFLLMINRFNYLYLTLFLAGICEGNVAIAQGAIVDSVDDKDRSRYLGYIYVCSSTGFILGPLLASFFSNPKIFYGFGPTTSFWIVGVLLATVAVWVYLHFTETRVVQKDQKKGYFQEFANIANIFHDKNLRYYYGVNFIIYTVIFGYLRFYPTYLRLTYDISFGLLSLMMAYVAIPFIIVNIFFTPLLSKLNAPKRITMVSCFCMGLAMVALVCFRNFNSLWFTLAITTFTLAFANTFSVAMISFMTNKEKQGSVLGNNQSLVAGAQGGSSILGGLVAMIATFLPIVFFGLLGIVAAILLYKRHNSVWEKAPPIADKPVIYEEKKKP